MYQFPLDPNQVVQFHGEITDHDGLRAVVTAGVLQVPTVFQISIAVPGNTDDSEFWKFDTGTNADDDNAYIRPDDYNASTNANVWIRIA